MKMTKIYFLASDQNIYPHPQSIILKLKKKKKFATDVVSQQQRLKLLNDLNQQRAAGISQNLFTFQQSTSPLKYQNDITVSSPISFSLQHILLKLNFTK